VISGFRGELDENSALPSHYAASSGNLLQAFCDKLWVQYSWVKNPKILKDSWLSKMKPIVCVETSVRNYSYSLRKFSSRLSKNAEPHSGLLSLQWNHLNNLTFMYSRSQWPRCLRVRSVAAHLLRFWVRIPPGHGCLVCCDCCVFAGRGFCDGLIARPEKSYRVWCVVVCDL
jgi:hypothetical protein